MLLQLPINNSEVLPLMDTTITTSSAFYFDESGQQIECQVTEARDGLAVVTELEGDVIMEEAEIVAQPEEVMVEDAESASTIAVHDKTDVHSQICDKVEGKIEILQQFQDKAFEAQIDSSEIVLTQAVLVEAEALNVQSQVPEEAHSLQPEPTLEVDAASLPSTGKKIDKKSKTKSRKNKFKPTLVTRLKLDANGEMVLDDSSLTMQEPEVLVVEDKIENPLIAEELPLEEETFRQPEEKLPSPEDVLPLYLSSSFIDSALFDQEEFLQNVNIPFDENLNETIGLVKYESVPLMIPSTSSAVISPPEEFDGEAFLNSLDLEKLVLVEAQRDGKDVYEIHEIDPISQEICDAPMDLPARVVDLIISVMTQQEDDDGE